MYKQYLSIFLFFISLFFLNSEESSMITIPLKVIHSYSKKYPISKKINKKKINTKFGSIINEYLDKTISGQIERLDCSLLVAPIEVGVKKKDYWTQVFTVMLDTGSPYLWVAGFASRDHEMFIENQYDPNESKTVIPTDEKFNIAFGYGSVKGKYYKDEVKFFNHINLIKLGVSTETYFYVKGADGVMGLAKQYFEEEYSIISTMYNNKQISSKSFSFKYFSEDEAEMYIGEEHNDFKDENKTATCELLNHTDYDKLFWTCRLYSFGIISNDSSYMTNTSCGYNLAFDTGSNEILLPKKTLDYIKDDLVKYNCSLLEEKYEDEFVYQIMCEDGDKLPHIFIEVGNNILLLNDEDIYYYDYDYSDKYKNKIFLNIFFEEKLTVAIIGQPFFKSFHTKFDLENNVLKFYSNKTGSIKFTWVKPEEPKDPDENKENNKKDTNEENKKEKLSALHIVLISVGAFVLIIVIILVAIIIIFYIKNKKSKLEEEVNKISFIQNENEENSQDDIIIKGDNDIQVNNNDK